MNDRQQHNNNSSKSWQLCASEFGQMEQSELDARGGGGIAGERSASSAEEERYRNILDNMEEAYYEVDLKGNLTFFNATAVTNLGYTDNVMMGMNFRQYVDDDNASKVFEAYNKVFLTGESIKGVDWEFISKAEWKNTHREFRIPCAR